MATDPFSSQAPDDPFFRAVAAETPEDAYEEIRRLREEAPVHLVPGLGFLTQKKSP